MCCPSFIMVHGNGNEVHDLKSKVWVGITSLGGNGITPLVGNGSTRKMMSSLRDTMYFPSTVAMRRRKSGTCTTY
jgi:hypothetical protein